MLDHDYTKFIERYRALRLGSMDFAFVLLWRKKLDAFDSLDLIGAVDDVAADLRAGFPLNDLPLLIEHATIRGESRKRPNANRFRLGTKGASSPVWDKKMLEMGVISAAEVKRRQRDREGAVKNG